MKLLLVDDDSVYRFVVQTLLKRIPEVNQAVFHEDAESAIESISRMPEEDFPDVFMIDINLNALDGWDVLNCIQERQSGIKKPIRVYIVSSSLLGSDMDKARNHPLKLRGYLVKPIGLEKLKKLLEHQGEEFTIL